ncbi:MAG: ImmA/IrrE family metallo-endopeptidase [Bacteroidota bacterium]
MSITLKMRDEEICEMARCFLEKYQPNALKVPQRTDLSILLDFIKKDFGFSFIKSDLGSENNSKVLGSTDFRNKTISIDNSFESDDYNKSIRVPFVIAHEIGHCIVHGPKYSELKMAGVFDQVTTDTMDMVTGKRILKNDRDFIEHQAHIFAASILVPAQTLKAALIKSQEKVGINRKRGVIYLDKKGYSHRDYQLTLMELKRFYFVSKHVLRIRLHQNSLIEGPIERIPSVAAIFNEMGLDKIRENWIED